LTAEPAAHGARVEARLESLEVEALGGLETVDNLLGQILASYRHRDARVAEKVRGENRRLNVMRVGVHAGVLSLLQRTAPETRDVRLVAGLLSVIPGVVRMGNQCVLAAELVDRLSGQGPRVDPIRGTIERLGALTRAQVGRAKQAFELRNAQPAEELLARDAELKRVSREIFTRADELERKAPPGRMILDVGLARCFEQIDDDAVEIVEQAFVVVTDGFVEIADA
jgi:phosphate uptake regulator